MDKKKLGPGQWTVKGFSNVNVAIVNTQKSRLIQVNMDIGRNLQGFSNRMLPQFQEPSLGWIPRIEEPFEEPFTVNCPRFKKFGFRINKLQKALLKLR